MAKLKSTPLQRAVAKVQDQGIQGAIFGADDIINRDSILVYYLV